MWSEEALVLGPFGRGPANLSIQATPLGNKIVAIANNAKAFDLHFILNRAIMLKWKPELIMSGLKIMCMKIEHLVFLDSASFLLCA